jgi:arylsulfatase A-like enzyme
VFLLVLDTVRADHLSVYGYERDTTPELARRVAARPNAVVFPQAYANGTWTVPSHASLFTGLTLDEHGAHFDLEGRVRFDFTLPPDKETLAAQLYRRGYATLGTFSNNWLNVMGGMKVGFERFFRSPHSEPLPFVGEALRRRLLPGLHAEVVKGGSRAESVNETLRSMIEPWSRGPRPLYVFANYADAHGPYAPPPPFRGRFQPAGLREAPEHLAIRHDARRLERLEARYDEELLYLDHQLDLLFDWLDERGILARSWVFVTSDHGEAFAEHGVTEHGTAVFNEVIRVPLIVFPPEGASIEHSPAPVSLVDVAATIAAIAGVELDGPGRDLRLPPPADARANVEFYGDARKARIHGPLAVRPARVVLRGGYKLVEYADGQVELYDLASDPGELHDVAAENAALVEELRAQLLPFREPTPLPAGAGGRLARDRLEELRELGYAGTEDE